jgi:ABC-type amino acid transport substrate-binding protein
MLVRKAWPLAVLLAFLLLVAACGDEPTDDGDDAADTADLELEEEGRILVGSDLNFPPFEFIEDGEPTGFDVDLFNEIADRLGIEIEYQDANFDTIFTQLAAGEFDAIISGITITDERRQTIEFTDPYFAANQALVVTVDSDISGVDDLAEQDVGAQAGTTGLDYANENFTDSRIVEFPNYPAAFTALEAGQLDAVLADLPVAAEQVEGSDSLEIAEEVDTDELYGIGVPQESTNLRDAINEALAEIIDDGTYEQIYTTWFEGDVPEQFQN